MNTDIRMLLLKMALLLFLVAEAASSSTFEDPKPPRVVLEGSREAGELMKRCYNCPFYYSHACCTQYYCSCHPFLLGCPPWDHFNDDFKKCGLEKVQCIRNHTITAIDCW